MTGMRNEPNEQQPPRSIIGGRVVMRYFVIIMLAGAMMGFIMAPGRVLAQGDTLVIYANNALTLDQVINGDTVAGGAKIHHVYKLVSLDTTYIFDGTVTTNENITVLGVPPPSKIYVVSRETSLY